MADFKIALGLDLEDNAKAQLQSLIKSVSDSADPIKIKVDTNDALRRLKSVQKILKELNKGANIKVNMGMRYTQNGTSSSVSSGGGSNINGGNTGYARDDVRSITTASEATSRMVSMYRELGRLRASMPALFDSKDATLIATVEQRINALNQDLVYLRTNWDNAISDEQFRRVSNTMEQVNQKVHEAKAKITDLGNAISANLGGNITAEFKSITSSMNQLTTVSDKLKTDFASLNTLFNTMGTHKANGDVEKLVGTYKEYEAVLKSVKSQIKDTQKASANKDILSFDKQKLSNNIDIWLQKNSNSASEFGAILNEIKGKIQSADRLQLNGLAREFDLVKQKAQLMGKTGLTFGDTIKQQWQQLRGYFTLYDAYSVAKRAVTSMFQEVNKVDMSMSGLYRVTDLTTEQYSEMFSSMTENAKQYGLVLNELIDGATEWAKLGFDGQMASDLGEISGRYQVVADTDAETATSNLVTAYKGFEDELLEMYDGDTVQAVEYISDVFNKIGNEYAISAEAIGSSLTRSASALSLGNVSFQQAVGLISAISEVTNDPNKASNALKIISMRLRGKHMFDLTNKCLHTGKVRMLCCV